MKTIADQMKSQKDKTLLSKNADMSKTDKKTDAELLVEANASLEAKSQEVETLENKVSALENDLATSKDALEKAENEVKEANAKIDSLEKQAEEDAAKIDSLEKGKKEDILAKANVNGGDADPAGDEEAPKDIDSFKEKYSQ